MWMKTKNSFKYQNKNVMFCFVHCRYKAKYIEELKCIVRTKCWDKNINDTIYILFTFKEILLNSEWAPNF